MIAPTQLIKKDATMINVYLNSKAWSKILEFLMKVKGIYVKKTRIVKRFIRGVFWILRTGAQWRELPRRYGKFRSVHKRFNEWSVKNIWQDLLSSFAPDADGEWIMIDSTTIRAHPCSSGYKKGTQEKETLGRSCGGFTTKIHACVDALGNCLKLKLTPGQYSDISQANSLIKGFTNSSILGDRGYDSDDFVSTINSQGCKPVIPSKSNRKNPRNYDKHIYKERGLIEIFFRKIKNFRRIFSRFEKQSRNYLSFVAIGGSILWLA